MFGKARTVFSAPADGGVGVKSRVSLFSVYSENEVSKKINIDRPHLFRIILMVFISFVQDYLGDLN